MDSPHTDASPAVRHLSRDGFREKLKKSLFYLLILGTACFVFLAPLLASASFFSLGFWFKQLSAEAESPAAESRNSQTLPLLEPATNLNPRAGQGGGDIAVVGGALVPQEGPSGTAADLEARPQSSQISVYVVHPGDTLSEIAEMFDVTVNTIMWANDLKGGVIKEGQELVILPVTGVRHTVASGDTVSSLAKKYHADETEIRNYNDLSEGATLAAGSIVIIPDGEVAAPVPSVARGPSKPSKPSSPSSSGPFLSGARSLSVVPGASASGYSWPVDGGVITQGLHGYNGVDIGARTGTDIFAAAPGTVIVARSSGWNGGYGAYLVVEHSNGTQTLYAHASQILVSPGQQVVAGQAIAKIGATGKATGPHLHFEVRGATNPFK